MHGQSLVHIVAMAVGFIEIKQVQRTMNNSAAAAARLCRLRKIYVFQLLRVEAPLPTLYVTLEYPLIYRHYIISKMSFNCCLFSKFLWFGRNAYYYYYYFYFPMV